MKPYASLQLLMVLGFTVALITPATPAFAVVKKHKHAAALPAVQGVSGPRLFTDDPATKQAISDVYNLRYDQAIAGFEQALKAHPQDPFAVNHLLQAVLLKELYRLNALDTTLYADNGFLTGKPLPGDPAVKQRIQELSDLGIRLANARLKSDPNDVDALYARGVTRALRLTYVGLVEKSFFSAIRNAIASRNDHERVLQLDPKYENAKLVVGIHNFVIGSLPLAAKMVVGIVGVSGSKQKGLQYLYELASDTQAEANADARVTLALFLRREGRYLEALTVIRGLEAQFPKNYIFALEEANLLKDSGQGPPAIEAYRRVLANAEKGEYAEPHIDRAQYGLGECLKGQRQPQAALDEYSMVLHTPNLGGDIRSRALLGAGEMYDVLGQRDHALSSYRDLVASDPDSLQAAAARKYEKEPFRY